MNNTFINIKFQSETLRFVNKISSIIEVFVAFYWSIYNSKALNGILVTFMCFVVLRIVRNISNIAICLQKYFKSRSCTFWIFLMNFAWLTWKKFAFKLKLIIWQKKKIDSQTTLATRILPFLFEDWLAFLRAHIQMKGKHSSFFNSLLAKNSIKSQNPLKCARNTTNYRLLLKHLIWRFVCDGREKRGSKSIS